MASLPSLVFSLPMESHSNKQKSLLLTLITLLPSLIDSPFLLEVNVFVSTLPHSPMTNAKHVVIMPQFLEELSPTLRLLI